MKKEDLIKKIQEVVPDGAEVVIFDHRKNLNDDAGDGSSAGIYKRFDVVHFTEEEIKDGCIPFSALVFDNEDYADDGFSYLEEAQQEEKAKDWDFWKEIIINPDGTINIEQLKKELNDFSFIIEQLPKVYYHITGGLLSKHMYKAETVISKADEHYEELYKAIGEGAQQWEQEYNDCRAILKELVELNLVKDAYGKTEKYIERKEKAWQKATEFLKQYQHLVS